MPTHTCQLTGIHSLIGLKSTMDDSEDRNLLIILGMLTQMAEVC